MGLGKVDSEEAPPLTLWPILNLQGGRVRGWQMNTRRFDPADVTDLEGLRKELSKVNRLRHKYLTGVQAFRVRLQRYLMARKRPEGALENLLQGKPQDMRDFYIDERDAALRIPCKDLWSLWEFTNAHLFSALSVDYSQGKDATFKYGTCQNCGIPLTGNQKKFCSTSCESLHRKRTWKRANKRTVRAHRKAESGFSSGCNPCEGEGKLELECEKLSDCLYLTLKWKNFNCERCKYYEKA